MAVDVFRQRFDDEISPQIEGMLVERRCKGIVDGEDGPVFMGNLGDGRNIRDAVGRIVRRFDMDQTRPRCNRLFHGVEIGHIDHDRFDAEFIIE